MEAVEIVCWSRGRHNDTASCLVHQLATVPSVPRGNSLRPQIWLGQAPSHQRDHWTTWHLDKITNFWVSFPFPFQSVKWWVYTQVVHEHYDGHAQLFLAVPSVPGCKYPCKQLVFHIWSIDWPFNWSSETNWSSVHVPLFEHKWQWMGNLQYCYTVCICSVQ